MKPEHDGQWSCLREGACCSLFAEFTLGTKCPMLKEDRDCSCYNTRPKICRVDNFEIEGLDKNEYLIARCHLFHMLETWKKDIGENASTHWILEKIAKSGIL